MRPALHSSHPTLPFHPCIRLDDTIAAIASPPGGGARGIVRLSGPRLRACLEDCFRPSPPVPLAA